MHAVLEHAALAPVCHEVALVHAEHHARLDRRRCGGLGLDLLGLAGGGALGLVHEAVGEELPLFLDQRARASAPVAHQVAQRRAVAAFLIFLRAEPPERDRVRAGEPVPAGA